MSDTLDYEGYYKALGVPPNASADAVKRAFRKLARDLHPDSNPGKDTTAQFQKISLAYEILKDPKKRADYNAEGARRMRAAQEAKANAHAYSQSTSQTRPQTQTHPPHVAPKQGRTPSRHYAELRMCASCGCLSAQPRITSFMAVRGMVTVCKVIRKGGVYCPRCAIRIGMRNNFLNWLVGWWAFPMGPPRTLEATLINIVGGEKPAAENVNMLYRQALGFHYSGHSKIALGIVEDALRMAPNLTMRDDLLALRRHLGEGKPGARLRNEWQLRKNPIFWGQVVPMSLAVIFVLQILFAHVNVGLLDYSNISNPIQSQWTKLFGSEVDAPVETTLHQVIVDTLPVYTAPNTSSGRLGLLIGGMDIPVLPEVAIGGWAAVQLPSGAVGYVAKSGLRELFE